MSAEPAPVGLAHDYLLILRGAERTFAALADCWPNAPIYTTLYSERGTAGRFKGRRITTSYLQRLPVRQGRFRMLLPLYPRATERLPVTGHPLVVSSSSAFAQGVRPDPGAIHVCYMHTPFRYAWDERETALGEVRRPLRPLLARSLDRIREWDREAASRVTHYIANSRATQERIQRFYGRAARVVHPPVEVGRFAIGEAGESFLIVTELIPHKRVHIALEAARLAGRHVDVVGGGPELPRLRARFGDVASFHGRVDDATLARMYARARALLVPNAEEFGIAAVESQAAGRPVLGLGRGGLLETVEDGRTGVLLDRGSVREFAEAMSKVDFDRFDAAAIAAHARRFSVERFRDELKLEVERLVGGPTP